MLKFNITSKLGVGTRLGGVDWFLITASQSAKLVIRHLIKANIVLWPWIRKRTGELVTEKRS